MMKSPIIKRSIVIKRHKTSVSLEVNRPGFAGGHLV